MSDENAHAVRPPRSADLRHLAGIEDSGIDLFTEHLGDESVGEALRAPAPTGQQRAGVPGFLLVAGKPVVGFVHVIHLDGFAHLEQVSVVPTARRQGYGGALVRAAMREAERDGFTHLSLCTYRDLPWNGPFYAALGFEEVTDLLPFQRRLRDFEISLGLDESGPRVVMSVPLRPERPRPPGLTVEPPAPDPFAVAPIDPQIDPQTGPPAPPDPQVTDE